MLLPYKQQVIPSLDLIISLVSPCSPKLVGGQRAMDIEDFAADYLVDKNEFVTNSFAAK